VLYDLNISPYLSTESPTSTAYFAFRFQTSPGTVHVYTAPPESTQSQWQIKTCTQTAEASTPVVLVEMHSRYGEDLPGDLAVVFSGTQSGDAYSESKNGETNQGDSYLAWLVPVVIDVVLVAAILLVKRKAVASLFSRKKATKSSTRV
jgi:hypothetical protein